MRVLQLIDTLNAGGAERMAVNIANGLRPLVIKSYLCTTRKEGVLKNSLHKDVGYLFLNKKTSMDLLAVIRLIRFVRKENITIIHCHSSSFFFATLIKLQQPQLKLAWHDHYGNAEFLKKRPLVILKLCSYFFDLSFAVNSTLVRWAKTNLLHKKVYKLSNFVVLQKSPPKTFLKGEYGKRILCVANLRAQKDHETLLKAFAKLSEVYADWTLHCVGQDFQDSYSQHIYQLRSALNLEAEVFFYGSCSDVLHIISQSTIGVLSSVSEGLPLILLEYGIAGLPVIATNVGACNQVIQFGYNGYLVECNDVELLFKALRCYVENENLRQHHAVLLQQHVSQEFSSEIVCRNLLTYYK